MKRSTGLILLFAAITLVIFATKAVTDEKTYDTTLPFKLDLLRPVKVKADVGGKETTFYNPKNPYNLFINYVTFTRYSNPRIARGFL